MPCLPNHRPAKLRLHIILPEIGILVLVWSLLALSLSPVSLWLAGIIMMLLHTILFYRLGRISERLRADPPPDFILDLRRRLT